MTTQPLAHCSRLAWLLAGLLVAVLVVAGSPSKAESAPEFRVLVHPDNPSASLDREFVADVYLKRVTRWPDGQTVRPVDQHPSSAVRLRFSELVLKRSVSAVKRYWQQRVFSGRELPPPELESDEAVVSYVLKHRGAIGYVSGAAPSDRAKPVTVH
jgi:ABC-type phosphate transport system substrate-binding protein